MKNKLISLLLLLTACFHTARADTVTPVSVRLSLTHIAADKWRADYVFAEPIDILRLGPPVGAYRKQAWRVLTPGVMLDEVAGQESLRSVGKPMSVLSVEVSLYDALIIDNYTAFDRFSDGGTALYLGFLVGEAMQAERERPLGLDLHVAGLPGETVIAPNISASGQTGYAYFGPRKPVVAGVGSLILDPRAPDWLAALLTETTANISTFYVRAFQRKLAYRPLVLVSIGDLNSPGLSVKGGVNEKQIVYRLEGKELLSGSPTVRKYIMKLIAHELAHLWQQNGARGDVGAQGPWIYEGGAEALALLALKQSGMFSPADADAFSNKLIEECRGLKGSVETYRGMYACGFKRFTDYNQDLFALWRAMIETSEAEGAVYSESIIDAVRQRLAKAPSAVQ